MQMAKNSQQALLLQMLRPLLRWCLRRSLGVREIMEAIKQLLVEIVSDELAQKQLPTTVSRISVATGLQRRDVQRLLQGKRPARAECNLLQAVIGLWVSGRKYCDANGEPRVLSAEGAESEFMQLVRVLSQDLNGYTVLAELLRQELVERTTQGVRLLRKSYVPLADSMDAWRMVSADIADLLSAAEENVAATGQRPHHQLSTRYDNVPLCYAEQLREWCKHEGRALHARAREFLSQFDRDVTPSCAKADATVRIALGSFSYLEESDKRRPSTRIGDA